MPRPRMERKRKSLEIKIWMMRQGLTAAGIAREVGIAPTLASRTINNKKNNRKVLKYLLNAGCPLSLLDLPADVDKN